jgi:hypothetical protein
MKFNIKHCIRNECSAFLQEMVGTVPAVYVMNIKKEKG